MEDKPLQDEIGSLSNAMSNKELNTLAKLLFMVVGDRSMTDHVKWDQYRDKAQDAAIDSLSDNIHSVPQKDREVSSDVVMQIESLPPVDLGAMEEHDIEEVLALEATGAVYRDGRRLITSDPMRFMGGLIALCADKSTWMAFARQRGKPELYSQTIYPIAKRLRLVLTYDAVLKLSCKVAQVYGVRVRTVPVSEVYRTAPAFVGNAGKGVALTLSTTSGVIDPLERVGKEDVLKQLSISRESDIANKFGKKDAWRIVNFRDGLLNPGFEARRPYFFDRQTTAKAMLSTLAVIADKASQEKYKNMAARNLSDALDCPYFELYEVPRFENWMCRYTRSSAGYALISIRHPDTKAIAEGIELKFKDPEKYHRWFQGVFGFLGVVEGAAAYLEGLPPLALAIISAASLHAEEELLYDYVDTKVLRRAAEDDMLRCSRRVEIGGSTRSDRERLSKQYIDDLLRQDGN